MTYQSEIEATERHEIGYYIALSGIAERFATHDMTTVGLSGTYLPVIVEDSLSGSGTRLDRELSFIEPGGFQCSVMATDQVIALLARKGGTEFQITRAMGKSDTNLYSSNAGLGGQVIHIGKEAILLGVYNGTFGRYPCTRAQRDTFAQSHADNKLASTQPRHMMFRRAKLYAVNLETGSERVLRTGYLASSPTFTDGRYALDFTDETSTLNRPVLSGWREVRKDPERTTTVTANTATIPVTDIRQIADATTAGGVPTGVVKVEAQGKSAFFVLLAGAVDSGGKTVTLDVRNQVGAVAETNVQGFTAGRFELSDLRGDVTLRQAAMLEGRPGQIALQLMLSDLGDQSNTVYDIHPGVEESYIATTQDMSGKRVGAALPSSIVDVSAWESMPVTDIVRFIIDEQTRLIDVLAQEVLPRSGGYLFLTPDGLVSWRQYAPTTTRGALTAIDAEADTLLSEVVFVDDEEGQIANATIECNHIPGKGFRKTVSIAFLGDADIYGDSRAQLSLQSRGLWVGQVAPGMLTSPTDYNVLLSSFDRLRARAEIGIRARYRFPWKDSIRIVEGERISLTDSRVPDGRGGIGISATPFEVTGVEPGYVEGDLVADIEEVYQGQRIAPSAVVSSFSGSVITFDTAGDWGNGVLFEDNPGTRFPDRCTVRVYDISATPPLSVSDTSTISSPTASTATLDSALSFTPAAGDVVVIESGADTGSPTPAGTDVQDYAYGADSDILLDAGSGSERAGTIWG